MEDAVSVTKHANNRRVSANLRDRFPYPYTIQDAKNFLERTIAKQSRKNFCIEIDSMAVGGIGLSIGEDVHRHTAEIGYWLGEEFWGRGVMSEVVPALVNYCFKEFSLNRFPLKLT
jgi:ribosomal-protein-alanine N-acetyltransferase